MKKNKKEIVYFLILFLVFSTSYYFFIYKKNNYISHSDKRPTFISRKKVLYVDSYDTIHPSNIIIRKGFSDNISKKDIELKTVFMDAKNMDKDQLVETARNIFEEYKKFRPDIVLLSDDAAVEFFANKYLRNKEIPVIFVGVNWDCSKYDLPCSNIKGQIEVELIDKLIEEAKKISKGSRISILTTDSNTDRRTIKFYEEKGFHFKEVKYVKTYSDWKKNFLYLSADSDILFTRSQANVKDWDDKDMSVFIKKNISIPTITVTEKLSPYCVLSLTKDNYRMGRYLAEKTHEILFKGKDIKDIKLSELDEFNIILNMELSKLLDITFDVDLIDISEIINE